MRLRRVRRVLPGVDVSRRLDGPVRLGGAIFFAYPATCPPVRVDGGAVPGGCAPRPPFGLNGLVLKRRTGWVALAGLVVWCRVGWLVLAGLVV